MDEEAIPHFMAHAMAKKERKRRRKNNKNYSAELLHNAVSSGWEDHEVAKLIVLVSGSLEFSNKKLLRFLKKTTLMSPGVIACLQDSGIKIKADSVVTSLLDSAASPDRVSRIFAEGFECGIISTDDPAVIIAVRDAIEQKGWGASYVRDIVSVFCSHSNTWKECGVILNTFCANMLTSAAVSLMKDVLSMKFVYDLHGVFGDLASEISDIGDGATEMLEELFQFDQFGELVPSDSDADENGNLRDFVVDDDHAVRYESGADCDYNVASEHSASSSDIGDGSESEGVMSGTESEAGGDDDPPSPPRRRAVLPRTEKQYYVESVSESEEELEVVASKKSAHKRQRIKRRVVSDDSDSSGDEV